MHDSIITIEMDRVEGWWEKLYVLLKSEQLTPPAKKRVLEIENDVYDVISSHEEKVEAQLEVADTPFELETSS